MALRTNLDRSDQQIERNVKSLHHSIQVEVNFEKYDIRGQEGGSLATTYLEEESVPRGP